MLMPQTSDEWKLLAANFEEKWNFPHCVGALDGKHVLMKAPPKSGSLYFNYKGTFSIVLLALVDANYKFIAVDIGAYGRNSDGGIFSHSNLGNSISQNALQFPVDEPLPAAQHLGPVPYVIVGDEAFPLQTNLMRPFPGRGCSQNQQIYNYRLSRARRIVENAFGILAARWRVFHTKLAVGPELATSIVKSSCVLHNFLQGQSTPGQVTRLLNEIANEHIDGLLNTAATGNRGGLNAMAIRDIFVEYFANVSPVPWQEGHVNRGIFQ